MIIKNISIGYNNYKVIDNTSFNVEKGKLTALLGLNGSGKTTIIKSICGLVKPELGSIYIDDINLLELKEKEKAKFISYVPQKSNIVYNTSVLDVVLMGVTPYIKMFQTPGNIHVKKAYEWLKIMGIEDLANDNYLLLSGGQQQIVIITRALLQNGLYLLLDEPDSSLDLKNKNIIMKKIRQITKDYSKGCLISMHNPEYALNFCDKILLLDNKKITEIDLKAERIESVEEKLSLIYGDIKIIKYKDKYSLFYNE